MSIVTFKNKKNIPSTSILIGENKTNEEFICISNAKVNKQDKVKSYEASSNSIIPVPYLNLKDKQRSSVFISGISGTGKSTFCVNLIKQYREIFLTQHKEERKDYLEKLKKEDKLIPKLEPVKEVPVFLFTGTSNPDPLFEKLKGCETVNINGDKDFFNIKAEMLFSSIVVFDDFEVTSNKMIKEKTYGLLKQVLEVGRKLNISVIVITHQTMNYRDTKFILYEADSFVVFPATNPNSFSRFAKAYLDLETEQIEKIIEESDSPFDFLLYRKTFPRYIQRSNRIQLI